MKTKLNTHNGSKVFKSLLLFLVSAYCVLNICGLVACTTPAGDQNSDGQANGESGGPITSEEVIGVITQIETGASEILIDASADSNEFLQGPVRVDISQIDESIIKDLKVGDSIKVEYPGIVGMSEPPFISANSLEVVK